MCLKVLLRSHMSGAVLVYVKDVLTWHCITCIVLMCRAIKKLFTRSLTWTL